MRMVTRGIQPPPDALTGSGRDGKTELERARAHYRKRGTHGASGVPFAFNAYKASAVKEALDLLFHGKCAYCETFYSASAPVDVEHFRPKSAVLDDPSHPGYWWLAAHWDNLLPSCIDCNRTRQQDTVRAGQDPACMASSYRARRVLAGKGCHFPLMPGSQRLQAESLPHESTEQPLLLNPCEDDPTRHLQFVGASAPVSSLVVARRGSLRGEASIAIFGLNRLGLVQERTRVLRQLQLMGDQVLRLARLADLHGDEEIEMLMLESVEAMIAMGHAERPYSAMVQAWLDEFLAALD